MNTKRLKITAADFAELRTAIESVMKFLTSRAEEWDKYKSAGLTPRRFRFDVFHAARQRGYDTRPLYRYMNDDNIDAALRAIMPEVKED